MKGHKLWVIIGVAVLLFAVLVLSGCVSKSDYETLQVEHATLVQENTSLKTELQGVQSHLTDVQADYETLQVEHVTLVQENTSLKTELQRVQSDLTNVQTDYDAVKADYDKLKADYDVLKATTTPTSTPTPAATVKLRRGQYLVTQDGTYLGVLDSEFASKSIFNDFGKYGSEFSSTSIWNDFSKYGSEFSSLSAFNDLATKPPMLFDGDNFICYVTTNNLKMPRVSPYSLIAFAESMGWK